MFYLYHINTLSYYELSEKLLIGRTTGDITYPGDSRMSGKHALISVETSQDKHFVYIEDLGSKNRTAVNREEIRPQEKIRLNLFSYIEIGGQYFILSNSNDVNLQNLNELIEMQQKKQLLKLEDQNKNKNKNNEKIIPPGVNPYDEIKAKEEFLIELQQEITQIETKAKDELQEMDEAKAKIVVDAKEQRSILIKKASALKVEIEEAKVSLEKARAELELKKKKIINLKDIPSD